MIGVAVTTSVRVLQIIVKGLGASVSGRWPPWRTW